MSWPLFKKDIHTTWKYFTIFLAIFLMYLVVIIGMYNPDQPDLVKVLESMNLPKDLLQAFGMTQVEQSLLGFLGGYLYGMLFLILPLVFTVLLANKLVTSMVDKGSMANILSTKLTRRQVIVTQALFLILSLTLMITLLCISGIAVSEMLFPGELDIQRFVKINGGILLLHYAIGGFVFFVSCLFSESSNAILVGAGIPVVMYLGQMLSDMGDKLKALRYFSVFTLYDANDMISGASVLPQMLALASIAIVLFASGVVVFVRKDLSL